jgi:di/tricarboxylate transporter
MTVEQVTIVAILLAAIGMFLWGRWRHDMVAASALLACVLLGLVPASDAFAGFGHPAVITVACVLVLSRALQSSGAVDVLARVVLPTRAGPTVSIAALIALVALLSGVMNNVGALALLMPVAVQLAERLGLPPGKVLMPLAAASILGGTMTLIGTPPNLIISGIRDSAGLGGFGMFDFAPVGAVVTALGVGFIALLGWRLVPSREQASLSGFVTGSYLTEVRVPAESRTVGRTLADITDALEANDAQVIGLIRREVRQPLPRLGDVFEADDVLVIEAEADALASLLSTLGLELEESRSRSTNTAHEAASQEDAKASRRAGVVLMELAVLPGSVLVARSASDILLRTRYGISLLAVSRQGRRSTARLRSFEFRPGDLLLMHGAPEALTDFAAQSGCVPLARRDLRLPAPRKALIATLVMATSVGVAAFGLLPAAVSFACGVVASMALRTLPLRAVYEAVDWPVIVLLGSLLPVADAMQHTGTAAFLAQGMLDYIARGDAMIALAVLLVSTMLLTDVMNNAATAAVMAPIALGTAAQLDVNPDTFLMAVAIGASCAFLTPIGHQNNTIILGPGGFRFTDYWRLGLPLDLLVIVVTLTLLPRVWPL